MTINDRKMFRQKLNPGGALVPLTMNAARQGIPKLKLLKNALIPFAIDQYTDIFGGENYLHKNQLLQAILMITQQQH